MGLLEKSRAYEAEQKAVTDLDRPAFHVTGMTGWINDPNGFSTYKGEYHLFFQYHPYSVCWGPMHWGHVKTKDFIRWEHLPAAIAPEMDFEKEGCLSGSAIELEDGRQLLFYTGMTKVDFNDADRSIYPEGTLYQNHGIAFGDGVDYKKYENNPNVLAKTAPKGSSLIDFRDPKIFKGKDGWYYSLYCSRPADGGGQILLYRSKNVVDWEFVSVLAHNDNGLGKIWECPDFFELDDTHILMVSPQEMEADGLKYHPGYNTIAFLGDYDEEKHKFLKKTDQPIDHGIDFYAPQTVESFDGRRIMIAWMGNWDMTDFKAAGCHFFGQMSVPRELHVKNGRLYQLPVKELETYRTNQVEVKQTLLTGTKALEGHKFDSVNGRYLDLLLDISPASVNSYRRFDIRLAADEKHYFQISYDPYNNVVTVDRSHTGCTKDVLHSRSFTVADRAGELKLRIVMDRQSVEIFANDGEDAATFVFFTPLSADGISFHVDGEANLAIEKYDLTI